MLLYYMSASNALKSIMQELVFRVGVLNNNVSYSQYTYGNMKDIFFQNVK